MSISSGAATRGRPPQVGRNTQTGPGAGNVDFRVTCNIPIHEKVYPEFIGEALNLANRQVISSLNPAKCTYTGPTAATGACPAKTLVPTGSYFLGCIAPFVASAPAASFGKESGTSSVLCGPRQLQLSAKLFF